MKLIYEKSSPGRRAVQLPSLQAQTWMLGVGLMLAIGVVVGFLPAWRGMRLNIVDALAGR